MKNLNFNQSHYDKMLENEEDYKDLSFEQLKEQTERGADIVSKNGGFANLDAICTEPEMMDVAAFINFRLAKEDLGEYVEEIDT